VPGELVLDFERIDTLIKEGFISRRKHPELDLFILNYTARVQYIGLWDNETINCRGLVVDGANNIVARSFPKFFNYEELFVHPELQERLCSHLARGDRFIVHEKMDGSLILVFSYQGQRVVASRGSFESTQVEMAQRILAEKYPAFDPGAAVGTTFLFEVIHPENRIVVDYEGQQDLYHLASVRLDGYEHPILSGLHYSSFEREFPVPEAYEFSSIEEVTGFEQFDNREGFVAHFPDSGLRVKFKWEEYKRLHRLLTGLTPKMIWEELMAGRDLDHLIDRVPDEFYAWVKQVEGELRQRFNVIQHRCWNDLLEAKRRAYQERKQYAEFFKTCPHPAVLFKMLDGQDATALIWKQVKPVGESFRCAD
jgi:hypothetical protein